MTGSQRVLVLHNRYRVHGGEERAVELHLAALERAGIHSAALFADSAEVGAGRAALSLLRGGEWGDRVAHAVGDLGATVVHCHNMQPLVGPRSLSAARSTGARVVLNLHNFRLFCSIGVAFRDGETCFRCRRGLTLPGFALNCRGSLPEAAVYTAALARQYGEVMRAVDRFVAPSGYAAGQLAVLGVPGERIDVLSPGLPEDEFAQRSPAEGGGYALATGRLAREKGFVVAIEAAALTGVPLTLAGEGPLEQELRERAEQLSAPVEFLGRVAPERLAELRRGAAFVVVPSLSGETFGLSALGAMAAGVPVIASRTGALPEVVGEEACVERADPRALAAAIQKLWSDPGRRRVAGEEALARARAQFGQERYARELERLYERLAGAPDEPLREASARRRWSLSRSSSGE